jgi:hypothetical protein
MESAPLPNSNNLAICNGVCMPIVKGKSFIFLLQGKNLFQMFQSPHMHIHMIINVVLPTPFPHLILILSDGLLNQKIISISFFFKKTCMVPYFFMFFVYLLNSKAIVQPHVNPSFQF